MSRGRFLWQQLPDGRITHRFEPIMLVLALLVIPVVLIEESHASQAVKTAATAANWVIWIGFLVELVSVLWIAPRKGAALRAHWLEVGIVVVTPPFFLTALASLRFLRLARDLRLARLGMLGARAVQAERVLTSRQGFRYIALVTAFLVAIAGAAVSVADSKDSRQSGAACGGRS